MVPEVAMTPVQSALPDAVHELALDELHCKVTVPPERASAAEDDKVTLTGDGGLFDPPPPPPHADSDNAISDKAPISFCAIVILMGGKAPKKISTCDCFQRSTKVAA